MYFNLAKHHNVVRLGLVVFMLNARKKQRTPVLHTSHAKKLSPVSPLLYFGKLSRFMRLECISVLRVMYIFIMIIILTKTPAR